jgi:hypothetical protein
VGSVVAVFVALSLPYEPNPADRGRDAGGAAAFAVVFAAPVFLVWLHGLALPRARIGPLGWTLVCLTLLVVAASTAHMPMYTGAGEIHSGPTPQELEELTGVAWLVGLPVAFVVMFRRRLLGPPASLPEPPG